MTISQVIRQIIAVKKVQKKEIADKIGILSASFSRMINNDDNNYNINTLYSIFRAFDCDIQINIIDKSTNDIIYTIQDNNDILL